MCADAQIEFLITGVYLDFGEIYFCPRPIWVQAEPHGVEIRHTSTGRAEALPHGPPTGGRHAADKKLASSQCAGGSFSADVCTGFHTQSLAVVFGDAGGV
jgi:hypothetical protein